jgi:hypothetical protein
MGYYEINTVGQENRINGRGDPLRWPRDTLYPQKLALTSPTGGGRSVGIVCLRTKSHGVFFYEMEKTYTSQNSVKADAFAWVNDRVARIDVFFMSVWDRVVHITEARACTCPVNLIYDERLCVSKRLAVRLLPSLANAYYIE